MVSPLYPDLGIAAGHKCLTLVAFDTNHCLLVVSRKAPARVERPLWSDAQGYAIALPQHHLPSVALDFWEAVITPGTDAQGWQYGTMFRSSCALRFSTAS